jgi:Aldo/keto reductase family
MAKYCPVASTGGGRAALEIEELGAKGTRYKGQGTRGVASRGDSKSSHCFVNTREAILLIPCTFTHRSFSPTAMTRNRLGRSGLVVTDICLGTMTFGLQADEQLSFRMMDRAIDAGIDFFDTAEMYPVPSSRRDPHRDQGHGSRAWMVSPAGTQWLHRPGSTPDFPSLRGLAASAENRLHRPLPNPLARPRPTSRGHPGASDRTHSAGQSARHRHQQRHLLGRDEEPANLGEPRAQALRQRAE